MRPRRVRPTLWGIDRYLEDTPMHALTTLSLTTAQRQCGRSCAPEGADAKPSASAFLEPAALAAAALVGARLLNMMVHVLA